MEADAEVEGRRRGGDGGGGGGGGGALRLLTSNLKENKAGFRFMMADCTDAYSLRLLENLLSVTLSTEVKQTEDVFMEWLF
jgi:hypothetical protein